MVEIASLYWAVGVAIGLPIGLVVLTEVREALLRRGSKFARPVGFIRNFIVPLVALLLLLTKATGISTDAIPVRIVATALGLVVLLLLLSRLRAVLFMNAPEGSWRKRIPSIFLDVARLVVIAVGLAIIFSYVWGANVRGLVTAVGISSIVLGLTLQNSVGQIISGLLVLFEQPFKFGDWVDTPSARGRVVEVNWRATHIDTGSGLQVIPNSVLAVASFANLSRPPGEHSISVTTQFGLDDSPDEVGAVLLRLADSLPQLSPGGLPTVSVDGAAVFTTSIPLRTPADAKAARTTFLRWAWYATRRAGLHLDDAEDDYGNAQRTTDALRFVGPTLRLSEAEQDELMPKVRLVRYGTDEVIQPAGSVPSRMSFIVTGTVHLTVRDHQGFVATVRHVERGDFIGSTTLTREPVLSDAYAVDEVVALQIAREHMEQLVLRNPLLLHEIGRTIKERGDEARRALGV